MIDTEVLSALLLGDTPDYPAQRFENNMVARLLSTIGDSATTISIQIIGGTWPSNLAAGDWYNLTFSKAGSNSFEIVRVTSVNDYVLTVERAQEGTPAQNWPAAATTITGRLTAGSLARTVRFDEISQFTAPQSFEHGVVIHSEARFAGPITLGPETVPVGALEFTPGGPWLEGATSLDLVAPQVNINGLRFPSTPALLEGQSLGVFQGQVVGKSPEFYLGAYTVPPAVLPNGDPLQPGVFYYDLTYLRPKIWTGIFWRDFYSINGGAMAQLVYEVGASPQGTFVTTTPDEFGNTFFFDALDPELVKVYHDGLLLRPDNGTGEGAYTVDYATSSISLVGDPAAPGDIIQIDVFMPTSKLSPGSVNIIPVAAFTGIDGSTTEFTLKRADDNAEILPGQVYDVAVFIDGVHQQPGVSYSVIGSTISFSEPIRTDSLIWAIYFSPVGGEVAGSVDWANITGKPATFPSSWSTISGRPATVTIGTGAADAGKLALLGASGKFDVSLLPTIPTGGTVDWAAITGKPTTFPSDWATITNKPATFAPSSHSHSYGSLTGIPATFAPSAHVHAYSSLTGIPATFAPAAHAHPMAEISDLPARVNTSTGAPDAGKLVLLGADGKIHISMLPSGLGGEGTFDVLDGNENGLTGSITIYDGGDDTDPADTIVDGGA